MLFKNAGRILTLIENIFAAIGGILLLFTTFIVTLEVISRTFVGYSFIWVNEITEYILLYIPFFCGAWLLRNNGHIVLDLIDLFNIKIIHRFIQIFVPIVGIVVCLVLTYYGSTSTIDLYERNVTSITPLAFPMAYVYFIIPLGSLIMLFEFVRNLYVSLKINEEVIEPNESFKEEVPL